uniref:3-deoxy-D-arabinoheptulosonate-7-phosphate synthase n=1 Tax=uncultured marine virus TaxID=186617 RepID=A0A0F7L3G9_9VIRU|nr:3-deoxy-D-arabinoheptulosonate-7-phosphate synthase [uncultured marine virus]
MCLRGIMSLWMDEQRFMPDVTDILRLRKLTTLPIAYDVSHPACHVDYVPKLIKAAELYEADAVMVEVHPMPRQALSDPDQQLNIPEFEKIYAKNV